jgi:hypothetical protein
MSDTPDLNGVGLSVGTGALPPLHSAWLDALTGIHDPPSEPKATCADCVMCGGVERSASRVTFSPNVKCCSYVPHLANFLVGRSLLGAGRESITARIGRRAGVTPLGLGLSQADIRRLVAAQSHFGRSPVVVCPHFVEETNGCAIWETRNAVCSTWFCKHERGAVGQRFWHAVRDLLIAAEERIADRCLTNGGLPDEQVRAVLGYRSEVRDTIARANSGEALPQTAPDDESPDWYARMWGDWAGREQDWFLRSAESVTTMSHEELISQMDDVRDLSQAVRDCWDDLAVHDIPDQLTFRPGAGSEATPDVLRLIGYSPFDPVVLPAAMEADLHCLDGRPIAEVREGIDPHRTRLDDGLLGLLHDFAIAVAPPPRPAEADTPPG